MKLGLVVVVVVLVITRLRQPRLMADGLPKAGPWRYGARELEKRDAPLVL